MVGLWTLYGVLMALQAHHNQAVSGRPISWATAFARELVYGWLWATYTPGVLWLSQRFRLDRQGWIRVLPLHLATAVVLSLATKSLWDLIFLEPEKRWRFIAMAVDYGILQYSLILLSRYVWDYYRRSAQLEAQLAQAQLSALRMQLHPHFLFNTLHAISELVHENPGAAERMIVRLSDLLRLTLDQSAAAEVPLHQEIEFLKRYLEIEQVRFEDRLDVDFEVEPATLEAAVPNFLLQPLVENALRHGLADKLHGGQLRIECRRSDGRLSMRVSDNGPGARVTEIHAGLGLGITQQRLQRLYRGEHRLELRNPASGGCEVEIEIPWKRFAS